METIADAGIRHVPVLEGSHLAGIVANQDLDCARIERGEAALDLAGLGSGVQGIRPRQVVSSLSSKMRSTASTPCMTE